MPAQGSGHKLHFVWFMSFCNEHAECGGCNVFCEFTSSAVGPDDYGAVGWADWPGTTERTDWTASISPSVAVGLRRRSPSWEIKVDNSGVMMNYSFFEPTNKGFNHDPQQKLTS